MKLHYVVKTSDLAKASERLFDFSHWIDLSSGEILITAQFSGPQAERIWRNQPHVTALPHPLSGQSIGGALAKRLSDIGAVATDTTFVVGEKAKAVHPHMGVL